MKALVATYYGKDYTHLDELRSGSESADHVRDALQRLDGQHGAIDLAASPTCEILTHVEALRSSLTMVAGLSDRENADVLFVYFFGHGYTTKTGASYLYSQESDPNAGRAGVSLTEILSILAGRKRRHLVLAFDTCRLRAGPPWVGGYKDREALSLASDNYQSILLLQSAVQGDPAFGGTRANLVSPFARALGALLSKRNTRLLPRHSIASALEQALAEQTAAGERRGISTVQCVPDADLAMLGHPAAAYFCRQPRGEDGSREDYRDLYEAIQQREYASFEADRFIDTPESAWQLELEDSSGKTVGAVEYLSQTRNPTIVVGETGAGKTILAKSTSLRLAQARDGHTIPIYVNAARAPEEPGAPVETLICKYLSIWRYGLREFEDVEAVRRLLKDFHVVLLIDCVDEVPSHVSLGALLKLTHRSVTAIVFCQPQDEPRVAELLSGPTVAVLRLRPLPAAVAIDGHGEALEKLRKLVGEWVTPLEAQQLRSFIARSGGVPQTTSAISRYALENIVAPIQEVVGKSKYLGVRERIAEAVQGDASGLYQRDSDKGRLGILLAELAYVLRRHGYFQQFTEAAYERAIEAVLRKTLCEGRKRLAHELLEIWVRSGALVQGGGGGAPLRFQHRREQELLIAEHLRQQGLNRDALVDMAQNSLWTNALAEYALLSDGTEFPIQQIALVNPSCAGLCLRKGVPAARRHYVAIGEGILAHRSGWARSRAMHALSWLPLETADWLRTRLKDAADLEERVTIVLALGKIGGETNTAALIESYEDAQNDRRPEGESFRRRILDALVGCLQVNVVLRWHSQGVTPSQREWARMLRATQPRSLADIRNLEVLTEQAYGSGTAPPIKALLFRLAATELDAASAVEALSRMDLQLVKGLRSTEAWQRCISALILGDADRSSLADAVVEAFEEETDDPARGDMAYVIGGIGQARHLYVILEYYACNDVDVDLVNDILLGIERAVDRGVVTPEMDLPPCGEQKRGTLLSLIHREVM